MLELIGVQGAAAAAATALMSSAACTNKLTFMNAASKVPSPPVIEAEPLLRCGVSRHAVLCCDRDTPPAYASPDPDDRQCPFLDRVIPENPEVRVEGAGCTTVCMLGIHMLDALHRRVRDADRQELTESVWGTSPQLSQPILVMPPCAHTQSYCAPCPAVLRCAAQMPYDMRDVLAEVVDDRYVFEMIPDYARNVISGFARLGGETVGIIANNPLVLAGVLDMDAAIKASRWGLGKLVVELVYACPQYGEAWMGGSLLCQARSDQVHTRAAQGLAAGSAIGTNKGSMKKHVQHCAAAAHVQAA